MTHRTTLIAAAVLVVAGSLPFLAQAQLTSATTKRSEEVGLKIKKMDLINQLLPVLLTPEQLKKILPVVEKARKAETDQLVREADLLKKLEPSLDKAISEATKTKKTVPIETMTKASSTLKAIRVSRNVMVDQQITATLSVVKSTLDEGQKKAAANSLPVGNFWPGKKSEEVSQDEKLRAWVKYVLLDPGSYDLLLALSRS